MRYDETDLKRLGPEVGIWNGHENTLPDLRRCFERGPRNKVKELLKEVFKDAEGQKAYYEKRLDHEFNVDAETHEPKEGFKPILQLARQKDFLLSDESYVFFDTVLKVQDWLERRRARDYLSAFFPRSYPTPEEDAYEVAARKVLSLFEDRVAVFAVIAETVPDQRVKTWAYEKGATWLYTQLSTSQNQRLYRVLQELARETGRTLPQQKLWELLNGVAAMAFAKHEDGQPVRKVVPKEAAKLIEELGTEQARKPKKFKTGADMSELGEEDEDVMKAEEELARRQKVDRIVDVAGMTPREGQAFKLRHKEGLDYDEIARRMGVTVKRAYNAVREAENTAAKKEEDVREILQR